MTTFEAVLIDMDGVVADTKATVTQFWQELAEQQEFMLTTEQLDEHVYGRTAEHTIAELFPMIPETEHAVLLDGLRSYETSLRYVEVVGAIDLLRALRKCGVPIALVTGAQRWKVAAVLAQFWLADTFAALVDAQEVRVAKPDPSCYLLGASRLGVDPERCVAFEDAALGVAAAVASGATCIGIARPELASPLRDAGAVVVIENFRGVIVEPVGPPRGSPILRLSVTDEVELTFG